MNIIDCHCHIYPDKIARKASDAIGDFYDIPMAHDGSLSAMREAEREAGIDRQLIFSVATKWEQVSSINRFIADAVAHGDGHLFGLGTVHPDSPNMEFDVDEIISLGLHGVKIHPDFQKVNIDDKRFMAFYEICERRRLPVLIHTGDSRYDYSNVNRFLPVVQTFRGLTLIGAHFGGWSFWEQAAKALAGQENLYVDCSSSFYGMSREAAKNAIRAYGADRVLFGTDYPMWSPKKEVETLLSLGLTDAELEKITHENAESVFGI